MYSNLCQPWPVIWCGDIDDLNPAVTGHAAMMATEMLWEATGQRFGDCTVAIRPCRRDCGNVWPQDVVWSNGILSSPAWGWPYPALVNGLWLNMACGLCDGDCSCSSVSEVVLAEPIRVIEAIEVDGLPLVSGADFIVYDRQRLVRVGGEWPRCQDWTKTSGPGTWVIRASFGHAVPTSGQMAAGVLTAEIARACMGQDCNLPPTTVRVVRQGVTQERINPKDALISGLTGLRIADWFITSVNPRGLQDRARAFNPDDFEPRSQ